MDEGFTVNLVAGYYLLIEDIWPDGDAPENPTAADVKARMEESGPKIQVLRDWNMLYGLEVFVGKEQVWK